MKKLLAATACSIIALIAWVGQASAGIFNCGCDKCGTFCVRPYNAFSPVCYGTVTCAGINPLASPGCGPNLAFHGSMCGPHSMYGMGSFPVMAPPMMTYGMYGHTMMPQGTTAPEQLPAPKSDDKKPEDKKSEGDKPQPENKMSVAPQMNPYGMTPWGVPVWPTSNPYAQRMPQQMPPQMPYGQMPPQMPYGQMPQMNPYGQMPPQMPYGQMPQPMPYGQMPYGQMPPQMPYGPMPNMMNPNMPMPGAMPPMMPNAR